MSDPLLMEALLRKQDTTPRTEEEVEERHSQFAKFIDPFEIRTPLSKLIVQLHEDIGFLLGIRK